MTEPTDSLGPTDAGPPPGGDGPLPADPRPSPARRILAAGAALVAAPVLLRWIGPILAAPPPVTQAQRAQTHLPIELMPPLPLWVLAVPASLALALLLVHFARTLGARTAALFAGICVAWYLPKELAIVAGWFEAHRYTFVADGLRLGPVPLVVPVGYVFTGYLSWTLAERITRGLPHLGGRLFPLVATWLLLTSTIAYGMETTGVSAGWWVWEEDDGMWRDQTVGHRMITNSGTIHPIIPYAPVYGWSIFALPFAFLWTALTYSRFRDVERKPLIYVGVFSAYFVACVAGVAVVPVAAFALASVFVDVEVDVPRRPLEGDDRWTRVVAHAPAIGLTSMLATSFYVLVIHGRAPTLLVAWLPFLTLTSLAYAGRHTLPWAVGAFLVLAAVELSGVRLVHHACIYTGLLLLLSALRTYRARHRALLSPLEPSPDAA